MQNIFARFARCESGATAIEYGLIAALISVAIIQSLINVKWALNRTFNGIRTGL